MTMENKHNPKRYGEVWPQKRIQASLAELHPIQPFVILSGGWAWHFMCPKGHPEYKHGHDHKDIDIFVEPEQVSVVLSLLKWQGFVRTWTKYDYLPDNQSFRRYEKRVADEDSSVKVTIDLFVQSGVPCRQVKGWWVVEPDFLLGLYSSIHGSDQCFAVKEAARLVEQGEDPENRAELMGIMITSS